MEYRLSGNEAKLQITRYNEHTNDFVTDFLLFRFTLSAKMLNGDSDVCTGDFLVTLFDAIHQSLGKSFVVSASAPKEVQQGTRVPSCRHIITVIGQTTDALLAFFIHRSVSAMVKEIGGAYHVMNGLTLHSTSMSYVGYPGRPTLDIIDVDA